MNNKNYIALLFLMATAFSLPRLNGMESPTMSAPHNIETLTQRLEQAALQLNLELVTQLLTHGAQPHRAMTALQQMTNARQLSPEDMQKCTEIYAQLERSFTLALVIERENTLVNARRQEIQSITAKL